jgi:hypothetical protein
MKVDPNDSQVSRGAAGFGLLLVIIAAATGGKKKVRLQLRLRLASSPHALC